MRPAWTGSYLSLLHRSGSRLPPRPPGGMAPARRALPPPRGLSRPALVDAQRPCWLVARVSYNNALTVGAGPEGLCLGVFPPLPAWPPAAAGPLARHPRGADRARWWQETTTLLLGREDPVPCKLSARIVEELLLAAGARGPHAPDDPIYGSIPAMSQIATDIDAAFEALVERFHAARLQRTPPGARCWAGTDTMRRWRISRSTGWPRKSPSSRTCAWSSSSTATRSRRSMPRIWSDPHRDNQRRDRHRDRLAAAGAQPRCLHQRPDRERLHADLPRLRAAARPRAGARRAHERR